MQRSVCVRGALKRATGQLPQEAVREFIKSVHSARSSRCNGPGPVDVHTSYRVWSALVLTSWSSRPAVTCGSCGVKSRLGNLVYCLFLGWRPLTVKAGTRRMLHDDYDNDRSEVEGGLFTILPAQE